MGTRQTETRDELIHVRLSPSEKRLIEAAAQHAGLKASTWMRTLALQAARKFSRTDSERP